MLKIDELDAFKKLNEVQKEAVLHDNGPLLVLAGAGTGKTGVLTTRLARILMENMALPGEILSVTFTNKAANEMKSRVGNLIGDMVTGLKWLGTFHSIGAQILRQYPEKVGLKNGFIIEQGSASKIFKSPRESYTYDLIHSTPPKKNRPYRLLTKYGIFSALLFCI